MRFDIAQAKLRNRTQTVTATKKLTEARCKEILNDAQREVRTVLQTEAPELYVETSTTITLTTADWIILSSLIKPFEHMYRLETYSYNVDGYSAHDLEWIPVERADRLYVGNHQAADIAWDQRGGLIYIVPEGCVSGTFRLLYHWTPTDLVNASDLFDIPQALDRYLITLASIDVYDDFRDQREVARAEKRAERELAAALERINDIDGEHGDNAGLRMVQGF